MSATFRFLLLVVLSAAPLAAAGEDSPATEPLSSALGVIRWGGVFTSALVIAAAWVLLRFTNNLVERLGRQFSVRRLLLQLLGTVFQFAVYIVTAVAVFVLSFRLDERVITLIGGTAAVAIGFALKDLVASFIAGIIILLDRPFQVGDRVSFGGEYGDITAIGLRSVRMQTLDDNTITIPNSKFLSDMTSCGNYGAPDMMVVMDFYIGADQDVARARDLVHEAGLTSRYVFLPKPVVVLVKQAIHQNHFAIHLCLKAYVFDTQQEKAFVTDVNLRVIDAFRTHGIQPPAILHRNHDAAPRAATASH